MEQGFVWISAEEECRNETSISFRMVTRYPSKIQPRPSGPEMLPGTLAIQIPVENLCAAPLGSPRKAAVRLLAAGPPARRPPTRPTGP